MQSTNIAETSLTIPDVKIVIDSGRERQSSLLDASPESDSVAVVASQLVTVNISRASAKQRAGRAGRVTAGICYRMYSRENMQRNFEDFATPEMLRMELSQLVLHSISLYRPSSGHPLSLLLGAPNPPTEASLRQTLRGLASQGLIDVHFDEGFTNFKSAAEGGDEQPIRLTPLGRAVCDLPVSPRVGRMLFLGLALRAIDPALTIAALLAVPKVFAPPPRHMQTGRRANCSDLIVKMEEYQMYCKKDEHYRAKHRQKHLFNQVTRVRAQLERAMKKYSVSVTKDAVANDGGTNWNANSGGANWNANSQRVAAQAALVCCATPHIAHLVSGRDDFATRDIPGHAKIHPGSVNFDHGKRAHWYVYQELRATSESYINVTTATSPLELALFSDANSSLESSGGAESLYERLEDVISDDDWLFIADQWVPVAVSYQSQRAAFVKLRRLLMYDMLQQVVQDPTRFSMDADYEQIVLFVLAALEHQRLIK